MKFNIEYSDHNDPSTRNWSVRFLNTFLNYHLIENFYGFTYTSINITIHNNPTVKKEKFKLKKGLNDYYAVVEVYGSFTDNRSYNIADFKEGQRLVKRAVDLANEIQLKADKDYKKDQLLNDLSLLESNFPETKDELIVVSKEKDKMDSIIPIKEVEGYIKAWTENPRTLKRHLIGIRIYDHFGNETLMPFRYMYDEILSTLLRYHGVLTPRYQEIYFSIDKTLEDSKRRSPFMRDHWHRYTYCALDLDKYKTSTDNVKEQMLFESLCNGLRLITEFDHLDKIKIEEVIAIVKKDGLKTILTICSAVNKDFVAEVKYQAVERPEIKASYYLHLTEKKTGKTHIILVAKLTTFLAPFSLTKMKITKEEVIITGGGGYRGEISREIDGGSDEYRFKIADVTKTEMHRH